MLLHKNEAGHWRVRLSVVKHCRASSRSLIMSAKEVRETGYLGPAVNWAAVQKEAVKRSNLMQAAML